MIWFSKKKIIPAGVFRDMKMEQGDVEMTKSDAKLQQRSKGSLDGG